MEIKIKKVSDDEYLVTVDDQDVVVAIVEIVLAAREAIDKEMMKTP